MTSSAAWRPGSVRSTPCRLTWVTYPRPSSLFSMLLADAVVTPRASATWVVVMGPSWSADSPRRWMALR